MLVLELVCSAVCGLVFIGDVGGRLLVGVGVGISVSDVVVRVGGIDFGGSADDGVGGGWMGSW